MNLVVHEVTAWSLSLGVTGAFGGSKVTWRRLGWRVALVRLRANEGQVQICCPRETRWVGGKGRGASGKRVQSSHWILKNENQRELPGQEELCPVLSCRHFNLEEKEWG